MAACDILYLKATLLKAAGHDSVVQPGLAMQCCSSGEVRHGTFSYVLGFSIGVLINLPKK
jgi:hypothetical protein